MIGAVDIGGTKIAVGMVDDCGTVLCKTETPTQGERGYADGLARLSGSDPDTFRLCSFVVEDEAGLLGKNTGTR